LIIAPKRFGNRADPERRIRFGDRLPEDRAAGPVSARIASIVSGITMA
jgi:hypothetical protein